MVYFLSNTPNFRLFSLAALGPSYRVNIQNQTRMSYSAVYRRERPAQYQPECRARRATRRLILGWPRASIHGRVRHPRLVVYLLYLRSFKSIYLPRLSRFRVLAMLTFLRPKNASATIVRFGRLRSFLSDGAWVRCDQKK